MIVGSIPAKTKKNLEVYFVANGTDEAFHIRGDSLKSINDIETLLNLLPLAWRWRRITSEGGPWWRMSPRTCRAIRGRELP